MYLSASKLGDNYPGLNCADITALQAFQGFIPVMYLFTSPGLSVANVDQCFAK